MHELPCSDGVDAPAAPLGEHYNLEGLGDNRALRCGLAVAFAAPEHYSWGEQENEGWEEECKPEADIFLGVDHGDLADEGADVNEEVE